MADRVAYATTQDNMTPANTSGWNVFPYPFDTTGSFPDYFYPQARTRDQCVELWWRIKNWTVSTDASITKTGTTNTMYSGVLTPDGSNASSESGLEFAVPTTTNRFTSPSSSTDALDFQCAEFIKQDSGTLYPELKLDAVVLIGGDALRLFLFDPDPTYGAADGSITGSINGVAIPVYYLVQGTPDSHVFSSFSLEPVEWWPYATTTALPVWDTLTGAMLNDPRS